MRVLLVEDNLPLVKALQQGLQEEGFAVDCALDGEEADIKCRTTPYDAIVLDIMLPKIDGLTLLKQWRTAGITAHVLLLTAKGSVADQVTGLDTGADDYLVKPVEVSVLFARLRALIRRGFGQKDPVLRCHDLEIDTASHIVRRGGRLIDLTATEYRFLELLAMNQGKVVTHDMFVEHLYDEYDDVTRNCVAVYIRYLRMKIDQGFNPPLILTRRSEGYMLRTEAMAVCSETPDE
jgi:DNA-binding response OmpR family regulator